MLIVVALALIVVVAVPIWSLVVLRLPTVMLVTSIVASVVHI